MSDHDADHAAEAVYNFVMARYARRYLAEAIANS